MMPDKDPFDYFDLPLYLQSLSKPIAELSWQVKRSLPECEDREKGLQKLLEAKEYFERVASAVPRTIGDA